MFELAEVVLRLDYFRNKHLLAQKDVWDLGKQLVVHIRMQEEHHIQHEDYRRQNHQQVVHKRLQFLPRVHHIWVPDNCSGILELRTGSGRS